MLKRTRDIATLRGVSAILSAVDARAATMTREHRQALVREDNYRRFVDALLSSVFINVAQLIGGSPERTKSLLDALAKDSPTAKA